MLYALCALLAHKRSNKQQILINQNHCLQFYYFFPKSKTICRPVQMHTTIHTVVWRPKTRIAQISLSEWLKSCSKRTNWPSSSTTSERFVVWGWQLDLSIRSGHNRMLNIISLAFMSLVFTWSKCAHWLRNTETRCVCGALWVLNRAFNCRLANQPGYQIPKVFFSSFPLVALRRLYTIFN